MMLFLKYAKNCLSLSQYFAKQGWKQGQHRCHEEEEAERTGIENIEIAVAHNQGADKILLRHTAKYNTDDDGWHGEAQLIEEIA